jgi:hypothetical protein
MGALLRSSIVPIIQGVQTQLINQLGFDGSRVRITAHWPPYQQQGDQVIYLWPKESVRLQPMSDGSGRRGTEVKRVLWVIFDTRVALDDPGGSEIWLTDPALGTLILEENIQNIMEDLIITDTTDSTSETGDALNLEPFKYEGSAGEDQEVFKKLQGPPVGWGRTILQYSFTYLLPLDQSTQ